jgi:N-acetylglucosamine-6-phosphate deacetylase
VTTLRAAAIVTPGGVIAPGAVEVEGDTIISVGPASGDAPNRTLVPGFVDLQVNGHDDVDVAAADEGGWARLDALLITQGVTTWCPALVTAPLDAYPARIDAIATAAARDGRCRPHIAGIHLEGPFLGGAPGAHARDHIRPIDAGWLAALPDLVAIVTLAPELDGAVDAIRDLVRRGIVVSLGHSTATFDQAEAAAAAGARLVTHLFNGMAPFHHRQPGLAGAGLTDGRLVAAVIADGVHLHPAAVATAFRAKGDGGVVLVTDAVAWRARRAGRSSVTVRDGAPRLGDGTIAGSVLTMDAAVRFVTQRAGVDLASAITAAATTPAALLGLTDRGRLAPGARADIVGLGADLDVEAVWIGGEQVL